METINQVIELTDHDLKVCTEFVHLHYEEVKKYNLGTTYGLQCNATELFQTVLQGYLGERAVGKYFNYETVFVPYSRLPKQDRPADVLGYEVRTVKYESALLLTHHNDKQCMYICVSIPSNTMTATIKGWSHLVDTLQTKYWRKFHDYRDGCYSVPEEYLYSMECLPETAELIAHRQGLQLNHENAKLKTENALNIAALVGAIRVQAELMGEIEQLTIDLESAHRSVWRSDGQIAVYASTICPHCGEGVFQ